jgi:hypothetical protein
MSSPAGIRQADPCPLVAADVPGTAAATAAATVAIWSATGVGVLLGLAVPSLGPGGPPHPTLHPSLGAVAGILGQNVRVLAAPYLLVMFRFGRNRRARRAGDVLVAGILGGNALRVGLALGRWQDSLLPYLPQLPVEYLAAAVAASAWILGRRGGMNHRALCIQAPLTALLLSGAAAAEVLLTPHRP